MPFLIILSVVGLVLVFVFPWLSHALLLSIPTVKAGAQYYIPFLAKYDLTVLACIVAGAAGLWNLLRSPHRSVRLALPWKQLGCMIALGIALAMGLVWTTAPEYGLKKVVGFLGIGIPYLLLPSFLIRSKREGMITIAMTALVGMAAACAILFLPETYLQRVTYGRGYIRSTVLGGSAIMPGVLASAAAIVVLCAFMLRGSVNRFVRYATFFVLPLCVIAILKTGTRSALAALFVVIVVTIIVSGRRMWGRGLFVMMVAIPTTLIMALFYLAPRSRHLAERWMQATPMGDASQLVLSRTDHYLYCLTHWWSRPLFGHGPGSFAMDAMGLDEIAYPHNILLEALYEVGMVGFVALTLFMYVTLRNGVRAIRLARTPQDTLLIVAPFALFGLLLLQSMVHWDLNGVRFLYLFAGTLHACQVQVAASALRPPAVAKSVGNFRPGRVRLQPQ